MKEVVIIIAIFVGAIWLVAGVIQPYVEAKCEERGGTTVWVHGLSNLCVGPDGRIITK